MINFKKTAFIVSLLALSKLSFILSMEKAELEDDKKIEKYNHQKKNNIENLLRKIDIAIKEENIPQMEKYLLQLKNHIEVATIYSQLIKEKQRILSATLEKLKKKEEI